MKVAPKRNDRPEAVKSKSKHPSKSVTRNSGRKLRAAQVVAPGTRAAVAAMQRKRDQVARLNAPLEVTPPDRRARLQKILRDMQGHDSKSQRQRVLLALQGESLTTHEARAFLDVLSPAARVRELRLEGCDIEMVWVRQVTGAGTSHRIAKYILWRR